ncbi:MAG: Rad52/Rad22 family DNA repair protein [Acidobacteriota bacterium]
MAEAAIGVEEFEDATENFAENDSKFELRSIRDIVADLSKPVAKRHLRTRRQGGKDIKYIAWHDAIKYLDHYASGWNYEIRSIESIGGKLILIVRLSIPCLEGVVFREATGQEDEELDSYGNSSSNSESMALRRAASKFGLGLYLYDQNK